MHQTEDEIKARKLEKLEIEKNNSISNGYNSVNKIHKKASKRKTPLKRVAQYDKEGNFIKKYNSIKEAHKNTGCSTELIRHCCYGITRTAGGFIWKYL